MPKADSIILVLAICRQRREGLCSVDPAFQSEILEYPQTWNRYSYVYNAHSDSLIFRMDAAPTVLRPQRVPVSVV